SPTPTAGAPSGKSAQVSQVASNCPARAIPVLKELNSLVLIVAPVVGLGLMAGGCGIGIPRCCHAPAVVAVPPRTPGSTCARAGTHNRHNNTTVQMAKARKFLMDIFDPSPR